MQRHLITIIPSVYGTVYIYNEFTLERVKLRSLFTVDETLNSDHRRKQFSASDCGYSGGKHGREKHNKEKRTF